MAKAKVGRPRSEKSRDAILDAALDLLGEKGGAGPAVEAIARRAGVGKPTIYRWWPTSADIVLEALLRLADATIPVPCLPTLNESLREFLRLSMRSIAEESGAPLRFLMARAQMDEAFCERFREGFVAKRRAVLKSIFQRAVDRGQMGSGHDPDMLADMVFGAMWYRLLTGHAPMDEAFADQLAATVAALVLTDRV